MVAQVDRIFAGPVPRGGSGHVLGLDIGLRHDRTGGGGGASGRPGRDRGPVPVVGGESGGPPVDLSEVEHEVRGLARAYRATVVLDPYQTVLLGQRLHAAGVAVEEHPFTVRSRRRLFGVVLQLARDGRLRAAPHEVLRRELLGLEVSETAAGWLADHRPGGATILSSHSRSRRSGSSPGRAWRGRCE